MGLLIEQRQGEPEQYASLAEKAAKRAETEHDWHRAKVYWVIWGKWQKLRKVPGWKAATLKAQAETFMKEAEAAAQASPPDYRIAARHMQAVIELLQTPSSKQERDSIHELYPIL